MSDQLSDVERAIYEWQMWVPGFGEAGQLALKRSSVLVSRAGGVGGTVALYLAAAGVGKLVIAHGGNLRASDLHRQILMADDWIGKPRIEAVVRRLKELNPRIEIEAVGENVSEENADALVSRADLVVDGTPMFQERFALNKAVVRQRKPMVECAMYELEGQVTTILPGKTPCLACLCPTVPEAWKRQFPVIGAVSGMIGSMGAIEAIKILTGLGTTLAGQMFICDLRDMNFRKIKIQRNPNCAVCCGI